MNGFWGAASAVAGGGALLANGSLVGSFHGVMTGAGGGATDATGSALNVL
jgi:hypothetical protein